MKHSLNIVIDANNFYNRTLYSANFTSKKTKLFEEEDAGIYMRKLATDFTAFVRRFKGVYSSIILCVDSKSWRKTEVDLKDADYKGTRKKKEEINWPIYNQVNTEFEKFIEAAGVTIVKEDGCEADDLIRAYVEYFKENKENSIVWSADNDLTQLIYINEESFNIQYYQPPMQKNSIAANQEFFNWLNDAGDYEDNQSAEDILFNLSEATKDSFNSTLKEIFNKNGLKEKLVNPDFVVFEKIIRGDKGDNILTIKRGIGKVTLEKLWDSKYSNFKIRDSLNEVTQLGIIDNLVIENKIKPEEVENCLKSLKQNVTLVLLDVDVTPKYVEENMQKRIRNTSFSRIDANTLTNMKTLLDGTVWFDSSKTNSFVPKNLDPFANVDIEAEDLSKKTKKLF